MSDERDPRAILQPGGGTDYSCPWCGSVVNTKDEAAEHCDADDYPPPLDELCIDCDGWPADYRLSGKEDGDCGPLCGFCANERSTLYECDSCGRERFDVRKRPENPSAGRLCKDCNSRVQRAMRTAAEDWSWQQ